MRALATDFAEYHRLRWRARLLTLPYLVVGGFLLAVSIGALGQANPFGVIPFLALAVLVAVGWRILGNAWRRSYAARPVVQSVDPTAGEVYGIPELDERPRRHGGLSGQDEPPRRW